MPTRIGIWFDPRHVAFGGPALVLVGTLLGFYQVAEARQVDLVILLNEVGDLNWIVYPESWVDVEFATRGQRRAVGPFVFSFGDANVTDLTKSPVWGMGSRQLTAFLAPSRWFGAWITQGLPFHDLSHHRPLIVWGAGVDVDVFRPLPRGPRVAQHKHDFFIYFKSQDWSALRRVHEYLFQNYFRLHGPTLMYYFYTQEELLAAAQESRFCIFVSGAETQGLASLEIMATGCPLFVLDMKEHAAEGRKTTAATSVTCWEDGVCGMKSGVDRLAEDFPAFLASLEIYDPRTFVESRYSYKAAAGTLWDILDTLPEGSL